MKTEDRRNEVARSDAADQAPIVVGVDRSDSAKRALAWAAQLAREEGRQVVAVTAWRPLTVGWTPYPTNLPDDLSSEAAMVQQEAVDEVFGAHRDVDIQTQVVRGPAGRVLVQASHHAALLVLGQHLPHPWTPGAGSVARYCAGHATCPVAVIRS